jgi:hypothetical protein
VKLVGTTDASLSRGSVLDPGVSHTRPPNHVITHEDVLGGLHNLGTNTSMDVVSGGLVPSCSRR